MEFFDHYLKGAKAPAWLVESVPSLKKDAKPEPPKDAVAWCRRQGMPSHTRRPEIKKRPGERPPGACVVQ